MRTESKDRLEQVLGTRILSWQAVSGGDIARAYLLETAEDRLFCKFMSGNAGLSMLRAEKAGLDHIRTTGTVKAPKVFFCQELVDEACLGMEFIASKSPSADEMRLLGEQLACMHQNTDSAFGYTSDNYIGSLPQSNKQHSSWLSFYVNERLMPQFKLALSRNRLQHAEVPEVSELMEKLRPYLQREQPGLLHGDLWSGNYLISSAGEPYLIDPAVYFGDPAVDLAMSRLFGGFGPEFYEGYASQGTVFPNEHERTDIYQLYYLLVHLNLFGRSYYVSVKNILRKYFPS